MNGHRRGDRNRRIFTNSRSSRTVGTIRTVKPSFILHFKQDDENLQQTSGKYIGRSGVRQGLLKTRYGMHTDLKISMRGKVCKFLKILNRSAGVEFDMSRVRIEFYENNQTRFQFETPWLGGYFDKGAYQYYPHLNTTNRKVVSPNSFNYSYPVHVLCSNA